MSSLVFLLSRSITFETICRECIPILGSVSHSRVAFSRLMCGDKVSWIAECQWYRHSFSLYRRWKLLLSSVIYIIEEYMEVFLLCCGTFFMARAWLKKMCNICAILCERRFLGWGVVHVAIAWQEVSIAVVDHRRKVHARGAREQDVHASRKYSYPIERKLMGFERLGLAS